MHHKLSFYPQLCYNLPLMHFVWLYLWLTTSVICWELLGVKLIKASWTQKENWHNLVEIFNLAKFCKKWKPILIDFFSKLKHLRYCIIFGWYQCLFHPNIIYCLFSPINSRYWTLYIEEGFTCSHVDQSLWLAN